MSASDASADRLPVVALATLGGTITMTPASAGPGMVPTLNAQDLAALVPHLVGSVTLLTETLAALPSPSLTQHHVLDLVAWAREAVDKGARGVVVAQGTDTLEETAFLADLYWDCVEPLVFTGAMRGAAHVSSDGPSNVADACLVAMSVDATNRGVLVVLDDTIHAAARVRKQHTTSLSAFTSPDGGPVGMIVEGAVWMSPRPGRQPPEPAPEWDPRVILLETHLGDDGSLLRMATDGDVDGVVIGAFGAGHLSERLAAEVERTVQRCPVVVSSRTGSGGTLTRTYGFVGSEIDLAGRGVVLSGLLDPRKSRLLLWALLASRASRGEIAARFQRRGARGASVS